MVMVECGTRGQKSHFNVFPHVIRIDYSNTFNISNLMSINSMLSITTENYDLWFSL